MKKGCSFVLIMAMLTSLMGCALLQEQQPVEEEYAYEQFAPKADNGQADIYLINCHSLNCIACSDSAYATSGTWNNLALRQSVMEFDSKNDYQFYIAKNAKRDQGRYRPLLYRRCGLHAGL